MKISNENAAQVIAWLVHEGKLTKATVEKALTRREAAIRELRDKLATLEGNSVRSFQKTAAKVEKKVRRRMTAARKANLKLAGQYMGITRRLSASAKAEVKQIRQKSGFRKAIAAAKRLSKA